MATATETASSGRIVAMSPTTRPIATANDAERSDDVDRSHAHDQRERGRRQEEHRDVVHPRAGEHEYHRRDGEERGDRTSLHFAVGSSRERRRA